MLRPYWQLCIDTPLLSFCEYYLSLPSDLKIQIKQMQELSKLGSPQQRLMEVVRRDKDIREFFSRYLEDIINYREGTLRNMSKLYRDVLKSPKAIKKNHHVKGRTRKNTIAT